MSAEAAARCIGCRRFTVEARPAPNLAQADKAMLKQGMGRCTRSRENYQWLSAEFARECHQFDPVSADDLARRRRYMARQRDQ